ncbi:uncharacterized protein CC84DRAFT_383288 [Paraphaeosphaeria sporulosa]|uniref:Uncharacterized protein n=1 Tax=Paraphaeosphaeria sporulosa TaxID=1460663 RepID=A0A177BZM4_9PLEO|nr:uncharacterized protein CC84DRAFT_383288 [Paraphaeosphaeria sporulosa]OAF99799.1 hypothetical protein CC84DRAFT_383288 [Paraphaeosphaeria sporulosa]
MPSVHVCSALIRVTWSTESGSVEKVNLIRAWFFMSFKPPKPLRSCTCNNTFTMMKPSHTHSIHKARQDAQGLLIYKQGVLS